VSEDRKEEGLILSHSVLTNISITVWQRLTRAFGWVRDRDERRTVAPFVKRLDIKTPSPSQQVGNLSGGNQQKVSLAKWLAADAKVLMIDEPTVGIDVKIKQQFHRLIWDFASPGLSILLITSDMPEMIRLADRLLVMSGKRIVGELANSRKYDEMSQSIMERLS
jgi:ribose transport system ATP-binding protein